MGSITYTELTFLCQLSRWTLKVLQILLKGVLTEQYHYSKYDPQTSSHLSACQKCINIRSLPKPMKSEPAFNKITSNCAHSRLRSTAIEDRLEDHTMGWDGGRSTPGKPITYRYPIQNPVSRLCITTEKSMCWRGWSRCLYSAQSKFLYLIFHTKFNFKTVKSSKNLGN